MINGSDQYRQFFVGRALFFAAQGKAAPTVPAVQAKIARARMKKAPDAKIRQRANKAAKTLIIKKFAGMDAQAYANLTLLYFYHYLQSTC